jgi:nucleoside 2-deoxyribosyltransferase
MLVFLSGAINLHYKNNEMQKSIEWREYLSKELEKLNIKCYNACENFDHIIVNYTNSSLVKQNLYYLKNSDLTVVNLDNILSSPGTIFELTYCYLNQKAVISFGDYKEITSPHILSCIDEYLENEDAVIKYIKNLYNLKLRR